MTTPKKTKKEILAQMNADAMEARDEFVAMQAKMNEVELATTTELKNWWERWFQKAGHKRLAYILMGKKLNGE